MRLPEDQSDIEELDDYELPEEVQTLLQERGHDLAAIHAQLRRPHGAHDSVSDILRGVFADVAARRAELNFLRGADEDVPH